MENYPLVSIIIPVKNDAILLEQCLQSLMKLDYPKEYLEIIIADGLSTDNTKEIARRFGAKVVDNEKQIVSSGRNCGFKEAKGDIIAFTDADCIFDTNWLKNSIKYFEDNKAAGIGGVTLTPSESSGFEKAIDFLFKLAEILRTTAHRQSLSCPREVNEIPGCNAIYRKSVLDKVMPVDENLLTAEDVWMNFCILKNGYKFIMAPDVILWHYRRSSPKRFLRQIYRFAIGRLQTGKRNLKLINIFHIAVGLSLYLLLISVILLLLWGVFGLFLKMFFAFLVLSILGAYLKTRSLVVALNIPFVFFLFIFAWSTGFLRELFFPLKNVRGR